MKSARHTGPAGQSVISFRAFNHCCDFIWSLSAKVGEEGHLVRLFWDQRKYEITVKSVRLVLLNQYCTINIVGALIHIAEWSKMNVGDTSETGRLKEAKTKCTQKKSGNENNILNKWGFGDCVQFESLTWAQMSSRHFWSLYPRERVNRDKSESFSTSETTTTPKFCRWSLLSCLLNTTAL